MSKNEKEETWNPSCLFTSLLNKYSEHLNAAEHMESSNLEDTYEIKLAIVGFSLFLPIELWSYESYQFIRSRLDGELSPKSLAWHGDDASTYAQFACLAYGALLGKYAVKEIDDTLFFLGEVRLPGFMHLHLQEIS